MKLLIITQKVDQNDAILGFFHDWLMEIAKRAEKVFVISLSVGQYNLPSNVTVYSLGKEKGKTRIFRYFKFYQLIFKLLPSVDKVLAHMCPEYIVALSPLNYFYKKDLYLWYVHRQVSGYLKKADKLVKKVFTASPESYQIESPKRVILGHGINVDRFQPVKKNLAETPIKIIYAGRITPIKNQKVLIEAINILINEKKIKNLVVDIIGRPMLAKDQIYYQELGNLIARQHLGEIINFKNNVCYRDILGLYQQADISINLSPTGGLDKTVLESMACQIPVLVANQSFKRLFNNYQELLLLEKIDPIVLADKIVRLIRLPAAEKNKLQSYLREQVSKNHDLTGLIQKLINALQ